MSICVDVDVPNDRYIIIIVYDYILYINRLQKLGTGEKFLSTLDAPGLLARDVATSPLWSTIECSSSEELHPATSSVEWSKQKRWVNDSLPYRDSLCVVFPNQRGSAMGRIATVTNYLNSFQGDERQERLIDHNDLYVLDFRPTLMTLCLSKVIEAELSHRDLPISLQMRLRNMVACNQLSRSLDFAG